MLDQIKELSQQVKTQKEEINRKRDHIQTIKQQKEQSEQETNQIMQDLEGLKDDSSKMQRLLKENQKLQGQLKDLKF